MTKMIDAGDYVLAVSGIQAVTATLLVAEGKHQEALEAAGTSTNHFALMATYQALTALRRQAEARQTLQRLNNATGYLIDTMALPIARILFGG
jgi:uncharacterized protein YjiS (DUF1127 family)